MDGVAGVTWMELRVGVVGVATSGVPIPQPIIAITSGTSRADIRRINFLVFLMGGTPSTLYLILLVLAPPLLNLLAISPQLIARVSP
jgi:hypothetical protein